MTILCLGLSQITEPCDKGVLEVSVVGGGLWYARDDTLDAQTLAHRNRTGTGSGSYTRTSLLLLL